VVPHRHLDALSERKASTSVDVLVLSMASWRCTSGCVDVAWLIVFAGGTVVIGRDTITVGGAETARGPLAFDGSTELG
jgi:hypothetical protein